LYRAEFVPAEDYDLFLRLCEVGRVGAVPEVLYTYMKHPSSQSALRAAEQVVAAERALEAALVRRIGQRDESGYSIDRCTVRDRLGRRTCLAHHVAWAARLASRRSFGRAARVFASGLSSAARRCQRNL
jgi:hypothetical protein